MACNPHSPLASLWARPAICSVVLAVLLQGCAANIFPARPVANIPAPDQVEAKYDSVNRKKQPITYVELAPDVLRPVKQKPSDSLPNDLVGPFELRGETLAAALDLVLSGKKIPMAFQTNLAMSRTVTMTGLQGPLNQVVDKLCSLADLYCSYEGGVLAIKEAETFTVSLPPMITNNYEPFVNGLKAITGGQTYVDGLTRSLVYTTSLRNQERAKDYFERLRANTALIVYEIQIWEVQLSDKQQLGIDWDQFNLGSDINLVRSGTGAIEQSIGIGAAISSGDFSANFVLNFLQTQGAVKTISQPQLTVLSGSAAKLRIGNSRDYISQITRTVGINTADNVSVTTSKLLTGLGLEINSAWDNGTVYGDLKISLANLVRLTAQDVGTAQIQLPETSDRNLETKIRVRPGDSVIIGGIVEDRDDISQEGIPGFNKPIVATASNKNISNTELVFMLRPRVVIYTDAPDKVKSSVAVPPTVLPPVVAPVVVTPAAPAPSQLVKPPAALPQNPPPMPVAAPPAPTQPVLVPAVAPLAAPAKPMPLSKPSLSNYLDELPADDIAPTP